MTYPPAHLINARFERVVAALGALARPNVLYVAAWSSGISTVMIPALRMDLVAGAAFIGAAWGGVALLYGAKAAEERGKAKSEAAVLIAQSNPDTTSEVKP